MSDSDEPISLSIVHTADGHVIFTVGPSSTTITLDQYLDLLQAEAKNITKALAERAKRALKPKLIIN